MNLSKIVTIILCLEVFLVPLFFVPGVGPRIGSVSPFNFNKLILMLCLTLTAFFLFVIQSLDKGKIKLTRTPLDYFILAFFLFYTLSFIWSGNMHTALFPWLTVLSLVIFYFLVVNSIKAKSILLSVLVGSAALAAVMFLASVFLLKQRIGVLNPLLSQSGLAAFCAIAAILAQTFLLKGTSTPAALSRQGEEGVKKENRSDAKAETSPCQTRDAGPLALFKTIAYLSALALFLTVIALINFQVGWIVLTAGSLLLISLVIARAKDLGFNRRRIILPIIVVILGLSFIFLGTPLIYNAGLPAEASLSQTVSFGIAWKTAAKSLFGAGPGNFAAAFSKYKPESFSQGALWQLRFRQTSNQWAEMLAGAGWPGMLSWAVLVVLAGLLVFLQGALLPVFLCLLVASIYISFDPTWWLLFFTLIAATIKKGESREFSFERSPYSRSLMSLSFIVAIVFIIFFMSFLARFYLADWHFRKDNFQEALRYNKNRPEYYLGQADELAAQAVNFARAGEQAQAASLLGQAINVSKWAFDVAPSDVAVCERRAVIFEGGRGFVQGANEWAIKTYEQCLKLEPNNPFFLQQLGVAEELRGEEEKALGYFQRAVELRPQMSISQYELGRIYYNRQDLEQAEVHFGLALLTAPDYANALYSLALIYEKQNRKEDALVLFRRVLELNPDNEDVKEKIRALE